MLQTSRLLRGSPVSFIVLFLSIVFVTDCVAVSFSPHSLLVEGRPSPLGIDNLQPRFSWSLSHQTQSQRQTAYRLQVSRNPSFSEVDHWDTERVQSSQNRQVKYQGAPLKSDTTYHWRVKWWDSNEAESDWSNVHYFGTGLFEPRDWKGEWLSVLNNTGYQLRGEFQLPKNLTSAFIQQAYVYVTGIGYFDLKVNGKYPDQQPLTQTPHPFFSSVPTSSKASFDRSPVLEPGWTTVDRRILYCTYDISSYLLPGPNVFGVSLGNGWAGLDSSGRSIPFTRVFKLQANIFLKDGSSISIFTNTTNWWGGQGGIISNGLYEGESFDERAEVTGWDLPEPQGSKPPQWSNAVFSPSVPSGVLSSEMMEPIRRVAYLTAGSVFPSTASTPSFIFDFGENLSGWAKLRLVGPIDAGTNVTLRFAEILIHPHLPLINPVVWTNTTKLCYYENLRSAKATDYYITRKMAAGEIIEHEPKFTQHGFRFVEIIGLPYTPSIQTVTAVKLHSDVGRRGYFNTSSALINQIQSNIVQGQSTNMMSIPTDCHQRDERNGWMGDAGLTVEEANLNFLAHDFHKNFLQNIYDAMLGIDPPNITLLGSIPDTVPHRYGGYPADLAWGTAYPKIAYTLWRQYGDADLLAIHYDALHDYINFWVKDLPFNNLRLFFSRYGDWVPPPVVPGQGQGDKPPGPLISAYAFTRDVQRMYEIAVALNKDEDSKYFANLTSTLQAGFHRAFYDSTSKSYGESGLQSAIVLAYAIGAVPLAVFDDVQNTLVNDIVKRGYHLSTGIIGASELLQVLTDLGNGGEALNLILQTTYPSWGYQILNDLEPATTLWELWDSPFEGPGMNSRNHIMFGGGIGSFFYTHLLGLKQRHGSVAYDHIVIKPGIRPEQNEEVSHVEGAITTPHGRLSLLWIAGHLVCDRKKMKERRKEQEWGYSLALLHKLNLKCFSDEENVYVYAMEIPTNSDAQVYIPCGRGGCEDVLVRNGRERVEILAENEMKRANKRRKTRQEARLFDENGDGVNDHVKLNVGSGQHLFTLTKIQAM